MKRAALLPLLLMGCERVYETSPYAVPEDTVQDTEDTVVDTPEDTSDTDLPTDTMDTATVETDPPDTEDTDPPDTDTVETDTPDSDTVDTDPPDTDPPDTDTVDTAPPDTDIPIPPFVLTDQYVMSGYMGAGTITEGTCTQRGGMQRGTCIEVQWGGSAAGWGGAYFQYPANNWGAAMGYLIPQGFTQVSLYAWGAAGGENVEFKAGISSADGFELTGGEQTLTTTPQRFTIDISSAAYVHVAGGLAWFAIGTDPITFYLDDIVYE